MSSFVAILNNNRLIKKFKNRGKNRGKFAELFELLSRQSVKTNPMFQYLQLQNFTEISVDVINIPSR